MIQFFRTVILLALLLSGCAGGPVSDPKPQSQASLKLYVFDCGRLRFDSIEAFSVADDETTIRDLIVPCYVVEHEQGRLLWDGGLASATANTPGWQGEGMAMRLDQTLADQLSDLDLDMAAFDYVAFSHMHFDHCGTANEVRGATLIIQQPEYEAAFASEPNVPGFEPKLYDQLKTSERKIINGDFDVFGDNRVVILSAPGHTPGHQVLFVDLAETGPLVLSGDLYHFAISRKDRRVPSFNVDADMTLASMEKIETFVVEKGAQFWIQHELALFEKLKKSPEFYD